MLKTRFDEGMTFPRFLVSAVANRELWQALYKRAQVPAWAVERVRALPGQWHLLVLNEDWCGDSVSTLPVIARLTDAVEYVDLRLVGRDANPDLMNSHLTNGARSIPLVMVLDDTFEESGAWGPRPAELQAWVMTEGMRLPESQRYHHLRQWYARDHGVTALEELISLLERAVRERAHAVQSRETLQRRGAG